MADESRKRLVADWLEGYLQFTEGIRSPLIYRKWAGICTLAGALQRKTWIRIMGQDQFPNLYVLFVGPPATGKSNAIKFARDALIAEVSTIKLTSSDITAEAFYIELESAHETYQISGEADRQTCITGFIDEWSVFVKEHSDRFMSFLADLYDNPPRRDYKTKGQGENHLFKPCFNMLGGITPKQLRTRFTEQALEGGFSSRIILVFSKDKIKVPSNIRRRGTPGDTKSRKVNLELQKRLRHDLEVIQTLNGEYEWDDAAADLWDEWEEGGFEPMPQDPKLMYYNERRDQHCIKLTMGRAAGRRNELVIMPEDFTDARDMLIEAEVRMPDACAAMGTSKLFDSIKLARQVVQVEWRQTGKPCPEHKIRQAIANDVEPNMVGYVIDSIVKMKWIIQVGHPDHPQYKPAEGL